MTDTAPDLTIENLLRDAVAALGGERRDGQIAMAKAVADAFENRHHLCVQAGTGTGKSLAYLIPALVHAVSNKGNDEDPAVIVATATLALQEQIVSRDLPILLEAISSSLPRPPVVALLKGRGNYVCLHKLGGGYPDDDEAAALFDIDGGSGGSRSLAGDPSRLGAQITRIRAWAEETETGNRDELTPGVSPQAWRQVSVSAMECLGPKCPRVSECFSENARSRAGSADLVVTNHAMLALESGDNSVLPQWGALVIDEAHEFSDRVTSTLTRSLTANGIRSVHRLIRRAAGDPVPQLEEAATAVEQALAASPDGRMADGLTGGLRDAVLLVREACRGALSAVKKVEGEEAGARKSAQSAATVILETCEELLEAGDGHVVWCTRPSRDGVWGAGDPQLYIAPLHVAGVLRSRVIGRAPTVLTSATLEVGGSLNAAAQSVGLHENEQIDQGGDEAPRKLDVGDDTGTDLVTSWQGLDVGSPFDYAKQGIIFVARDLPAPGRMGVPEEQYDMLERLIVAAGGRTLGLFSSRNAAETAVERLRKRLPHVDFLCQGEQGLAAHVEQFVADEKSCLFGTLSLWQGIDAPGASCRLVTIDRIPFPRPDDPLSSARQDAVSAAGGNGFMAVSATHAALLLAQGAGRLIRTVDDRGVVAVLDPRLATARYGSFLMNSMPPMWRTTDADAACAALERLKGDVESA